MLNLRQPTRVILACLLWARLLAACAPAAPETVSLKVVNQPFISFAPFHIALAEGYFAEQGLEVELVDFVQTQEIIPALLAGQVDVAAGFVSAGLLNTIARGGETIIVADKGYIDPNGCDSLAMIARAGLADAENPDTLRGAKVAVPPGTWAEYFLDRLLGSVGVTPTDVEKITLASPSQPEALSQGSLDYTVQNEPWVYRMEGMGHQRVLSPATEFLPGSQVAVMYYGPKLMGDNAEVGRRFMVAYLKAVRQYNAGKTERNIEILAPANNLDEETLQAMCWPALRADGQVNGDSLLDFQAWAVEAGLVETPLTLEQMWDSSYVEQAAPELE